MASVDGSKSIQAASDELFDHVCGPCQIGGNDKEAKKYCSDCSEYLCDPCVSYHRTLALTKNHKIVPANSESFDTGRCLTVYCGCNKNQEVEFYCEDHADVICRRCQSIKHHKCKTSTIHQKSSGYTSTKLESILSKMRSLKDKYDQLKQECSGDKKELKELKEVCKKEIRAFRKELDDFLDKLEQNMLAELDQFETKESHRVDQQITTLSMALQMLNADDQLLNDARKDARKQVMFAAEVQTSKGLQECQSRLVDLEKEIVKLSLSFERNTKLDDLKRDINTLGSLKMLEEAAKQCEKTVLLDRKIQSRKEVNVRLADDKTDPGICGCAVMPNGYIVICDRNNERIKLLDNSLVHTDSLNLPEPWDVSAVDANNVIATLCEQKQLQYVQVLPQMKTGRVLQLDKMCWGVAVSGDDIYVSCRNYGAEGEVRVLDKRGNLKRRLGVNKDGSFLFTKPDYITVNTAGDKVFVSSLTQHTITCMTVDGSIIYQYRDKDLKYPHGLYCDDGDIILVCDYDSNNVQMITAVGKKAGTVLSVADGLKMPCSISFRKSDNTLFVGCQGLISVRF